MSLPVSVFVYGTLKPTERNHAVARFGGVFEVREAYLDGFVLYGLEPEGYPAIIPGSGRVHGVLLDYQDIATALPFLDELEALGETPPLYARIQALALPMQEEVWAYVHARQERLLRPGATRIVNGRWSEQDFC